MGPTKGTNSTAELTAIAMANLYILQAGVTDALVVYDAKYAANMATAAWDPSTNISLVNTVTRLLD